MGGRSWAWRKQRVKPRLTAGRMPSASMQKAMKASRLFHCRSSRRERNREENPTPAVTLLEIMIALTIFAVISTLAWQILDGAMRTSSATEASAAKLNQLQRAWSLMERDFYQLQARAPRNEPDTFRQGDDGLELTTLNGVSGTVQLERVRWRLEEGDCTGMSGR